jgi:hypothetical protein
MKRALFVCIGNAGRSQMDPVGMSSGDVRALRDDIERRVAALAD